MLGPGPQCGVGSFGTSMLCWGLAHSVVWGGLAPPCYAGAWPTVWCGEFRHLHAMLGLGPQCSVGRFGTSMLCCGLAHSVVWGGSAPPCYAGDWPTVWCGEFRHLHAMLGLGPQCGVGRFGTSMLCWGLAHSVVWGGSAPPCYAGAWPTV